VRVWLPVLISVSLFACASANKAYCKKQEACFERADDAELDACVQNWEDSAAEAESTGCVELYTAWVDCLDANAACNSGLYGSDLCLQIAYDYNQCLILNAPPTTSS